MAVLRLVQPRRQFGDLVRGQIGGLREEELDALPSAGDQQQPAVQRLIPSVGQALGGKGAVEGLAMQFLGLGQGAVDVEDQCVHRADVSHGAATPRLPRGIHRGCRSRCRD